MIWLVLALIYSPVLVKGMSQTSIKLDLLRHGKHRVVLPLSTFVEAPVFRRSRVHLVEDTSELWPLIADTAKVCTTEDGQKLADEERFRVFASERPDVASWVHQQLRGEFDDDIIVSEITPANCPADKAVLNDYGDHLQAVRCAGMDQVAPFYGKQDKIFHCDYGKVTGHIEEDHGVQVNLWLNLVHDRPITDFMLGFFVDEEEGGRVLEAGPFLEKLDAESKKRKREVDEGQGDIEGRLEAARLGVRVWPGMTTAQALIFQATGAAAVFHGCTRYADRSQQSCVPRQSLEYRFMIKKTPK